MSREKQIEEMSADICRLKHNCNDVCNPINTCNAFKYARRAYEAGYRKQEWISVEERLPKNYRPVLVACEGLTIGGYAPIAIGSYGGGLWSLADADGTAYLTKYMRCTVTHWMPLPEPPKGE